MSVSLSLSITVYYEYIAFTSYYLLLAWQTKLGKSAVSHITF